LSAGGRFGAVDYRRMPATCRRVWGEKVYRKYDQEQYDAFLAECKEALRRGDKKGPKVHTGGLLPHTITAAAVAGDAAADLQWHGLVTRCAEARARGEGCAGFVPVCDVSGSMSGEPMEVAVALSLLLAESAPKTSVLRGGMFTFHSKPTFVRLTVPDHEGGEVRDGALAERVRWVKSIEWGCSTNLDLVFDRIIDMALTYSMPPEQVRRMAVVVFSDMEFDQGVATRENAWETAHEAICNKFRLAGLGEVPPTIVYWNLRDSRSVPVEGTRRGVAMLSGFSSGLLESFLEGKLDDFTPVRQMMKQLERECYQRVVV